MAASEIQAELDTIGDGSLPNDKELATTARSEDKDAMAGYQEVDLEPRFVCPLCGRPYATRKSLTRHLSSTNAVCAKRHKETQTQASKGQKKPRWSCSRCGKDCATIHSVERHIKISCWRTCDECAADGATHCDSTAKVGACRTCEAKERSCTKHVSAIPGSISQPWTGLASQPWQMSPADEDTMATIQQRQTKRKASTSPRNSPEALQKNKCRVRANQQFIDHGLGRVYDPLGGQAYVPPVVKKAAVSKWLQEQQKKNSSSAALAQEHTQNNSPLLPQTSSTQMRYGSQRFGQFVEPSHIFGCALLPSANGLTSQLGCEKNLPIPPSFLSYRITGHGSTIPPPMSDIPDLLRFGGEPAPTTGGPVQLDRLFHQMQTTRQRDEARKRDMTMRSDPRNGVILPPPFSSGISFNLEGRLQTSQTQCIRDPTIASTGMGQDDAVLTLRIHSSNHDMNNQPIFSILRIRRDEIFGPRLATYCTNRGKKYGEHCVFVYRYEAAAHRGIEQHLQITLTWDMTPNDVKDGNFPGMAIRNLDTIYVMQAKPLALAETKVDLKDGGAVQFSGLQASHEAVDIINGETNIFQNPDVSRKWYQAIEKDAIRLRAIHSRIESTNIHQMQQISNKDKIIAQLQQSITQLTTISPQLRERIQLSFSEYPFQACVPTSSQAPAGCVIQQHLGPLHAQQQAVQRPKADLNAFVAKCEAVRDTQTAGLQQLEQLHFPRSSSEFALPSYVHQPNVNTDYNRKAQHLGRLYDLAETIVGEGRVEKANVE